MTDDGVYDSIFENMNNSYEEGEGMLAYFRKCPETVREKADELEDDGYEATAGYTRYHLALALGERPDREDAEVAGLPMPEELSPKTEESS